MEGEVHVYRVVESEREREREKERYRVVESEGDRERERWMRGRREKEHKWTYGKGDVEKR